MMIVAVIFVVVNTQDVQSPILVSGLAGTIDKVTVSINNYSDEGPDHESLLLVGSNRQKVSIMFNVGDGIAVTNATLTFDDDAPNTIPFGGPITSGRFKLSVNGTPPDLPAPAPTGPYSTVLSSFIGTNPNGSRNLFGYNPFGGGHGIIEG